MHVSRLTQVALVTAVVASLTLIGGRSLVFAAPAQDPAPAQAAPPPPPPHHEHEMPEPSNLKVLPRNTTGEQIHEIMHKWSAELGTGCKTCHVVDAKNVGPDGKPRLNYADDSKEEKRTARVMFKMVEDINANYVAKIDSSGAPVTCGTCHRGHLGPEPYVPSVAAEHAH
jgi:cytochrome c553